jgi:hypothetical protein
MEISRSNISAMPTVGVVTFDAYVGMYAETLRYVSWKLQRLGCTVVKVGCDGIFGACTSLNSAGKNVIDSRVKESICKTCKDSQLKMPANLVSNVSGHQAHLKQDAIDFLNEVEATLKKQLAVSSVLDMHYQQLPMCKIAFFDFGIQLKVSPTSQLNKLAIARFMLGLRDLVVLQQHLLTSVQINMLTHVVYVNGNYSLNTLVRMLCESKKIICLSIEPQLTSQHILNYIFLKQDRIELSPEALFAVNPELNINPKYLSQVLDNFGARIIGGDFNAYTSLSEVCNQNETEKFMHFFESHTQVHSFFMSSEDELVPHTVTHDFLNSVDEESGTAYKNQIEFTQFYLAEATKNPDIGFIVRLHPRMAVNKRDAFESAEHIRYKNLLAQTVSAPNVLIILGDSKVSSYFIISKSNLVIVSWSTIGLEALMMGIPVVSAFPNNLMYPINKFSKQPQNFDELKRALFSHSEYGITDDMRLFNWVSMAQEGQFFPTLAPRGRGGQLGRAYRLIYRVVDKVGVYNLFALMIDKIWFSDTIFSEEILLGKKEKKESSKMQTSQCLINSYRTKINKMLNQYEKKLFESARDLKLSTHRKINED